MMSWISCAGCGRPPLPRGSSPLRFDLEEDLRRRLHSHGVRGPDQGRASRGLLDPDQDGEVLARNHLPREPGAEDPGGANSPSEHVACRVHREIQVAHAGEHRFPREMALQSRMRGKQVEIAFSSVTGEVPEPEVRRRFPGQGNFSPASAGESRTSTISRSTRCPSTRSRSLTSLGTPSESGSR